MGQKDLEVAQDRHAKIQRTFVLSQLHTCCRPKGDTASDCSEHCTTSYCCFTGLLGENYVISHLQF